MNVNHAQLVCLQFWFVIHGESNSKLEVFFKNTAKTTSLWRTANSTSGEWTFGQVELPDSSTGKVSELTTFMITLGTRHVHDK